MANYNKERKIKERLLKGYTGRCFYCGDEVSKKDVILEHVTTRSRGGENHIDNCVLACSSCNSSKGPSTIKEWLISNIKKRNYHFSRYIYRENIVKTLENMLGEEDV